MGSGVSKNKAVPNSKELQLFEEMDANGNGTLSVSEITAALEKHAAAVQFDWPRDTIASVVQFFDRNGDGELDKAEFAEVVAELKRREAGHKSKPGKLPPLSRKSHSADTVGVPGLSEELASKARQIFDSVDGSNDGHIQKSELRQALWGLRRSEDGTTETELAFIAYIDQEFAKADKNLDAKLDFKEFCSMYVTICASIKT